MSGIPDLHISPEKTIGTTHPCFIIAEIGQNHQGDINIAKQLIRISKECGADCVKFQKSCLREKFTKGALARNYDSVHSWGRTYGEHKRHLEFSEEQILELQKYSADIGILFTASAMDPVSLDFLDSIGVPFIKIGSGDADNQILLEKAAAKHRPLVISTGMSDMEGVRRIYETIRSAHQKFALLHCVSAYPVPARHVNLRVLASYRAAFPGVHLGYSGHELGVAISLAAVAMGAKIIERHITLDKSMKGNDHGCSLEPEEFRLMVDQIRVVEAAMGSGRKAFQDCERECGDKLAKSIVAAEDTEEGSVLTLDNIKIKVSHPKGLSPRALPEVLGSKTARRLAEDESISKEDLIR